MSLASPLQAVAALADPLRRRLYELVAADDDGLTRDDAATAAGVPRHVAAYHLDHLAGAGLLDVGHRRAPGRSGPGAGRPAKVYRRADAAVEVSLPPRNHRLAAEVLLDARGGAVARARLIAAASRRGARMGAAARARSGRRPSRALLYDALELLLRDGGFEPRRRGATLRLGNCPFHELAETDRATVCAMNLALMEGVADGMQLRGVRAQPQPPGTGCCVAFRSGSAARPR